MANIRDVARLAGVSISSVSNLLNNRSHQMSAQTRERIEQVMATLGYRPAGRRRCPHRRPRSSACCCRRSSTRAFQRWRMRSTARRGLTATASCSATPTARNRKRPRLSTICSCMACAASSWRRATFARPILSAAERGMKIVSYDNPFRAGGHRYPAVRQRLDGQCRRRAPGRSAPARTRLPTHRVRHRSDADRRAQPKIDGFLSALGHSLSERQRVIEGKANSLRRHGNV